MARGRGGGWGGLKQKWQEDHRFPDTRVFLLERKEAPKRRGGEGTAEMRMKRRHE